MGTNKRYSHEFKTQAVELAESMGNVAAAAKQLGVSDSTIHGWKEEMIHHQVLGGIKPEGLVDVYEENKKLRKENAELKKVNHILKAAAAFFCQDQHK